MKKALCVFGVILFIMLAVVFFYTHKAHIQATILVNAIKLEDYEEVKRLLEKGIDPNVATTSKFTEFLLNAVESGGERPLTVACEYGNIQIVSLLIEYGATAEHNDKGDWSPLQETLFHYQNDDKEIVELLLSHGADAKEENSRGSVIISAAEMIPKKYDIRKTKGNFYEKEYNEDVAKAITDIVQSLLYAADYDVNMVSTNDGSTLLMAACKSGNQYLVEYLLKEGININAKDVWGKTAYDYAVQSKNEGIIAILQNWNAVET